MSGYSEFGKNGAPDRDDESPPPAPRWVKAFGIVAIALVLLFIVMMVSGHGGPHSPLRHFRSHARRADAPAASGAPRP